MQCIISISISNPVNQLHEIHMPERMAYTWKWIQSLFCTLLHWIRSVPGRCDDVVVVVRFGTYKVGFQVKDRASPELCGRNTSVMVFISYTLEGYCLIFSRVERDSCRNLALYWNVCTAVGFSISVFLGCYGSVFAASVHFPLPSCGCYEWRWRWVCVVKRWVELIFLNHRRKVIMSLTKVAWWIAWKLKLKWSEVGKEAVRGGRLHRDSTLMGEVDLNHQSLVIGRMLYLTTSAPGIWTRELPIGKQEC